MSYGYLPIDEQEKKLLDIDMIESVLSSQKLVIDIPNYVNGRPTPINAQLIKTSIWLVQKNYMQPQEIHHTLVAFEM